MSVHWEYILVTAMQHVQIRMVPLLAHVTQAILEMENFVKVFVIREKILLVSTKDKHFTIVLKSMQIRFNGKN